MGLHHILCHRAWQAVTEPSKLSQSLACCHSGYPCFELLHDRLLHVFKEMITLMKITINDSSLLINYARSNDHGQEFYTINAIMNWD